MLRVASMVHMIISSLADCPGREEKKEKPGPRALDSPAVRLNSHYWTTPFAMPVLGRRKNAVLNFWKSDAGGPELLIPDSRVTREVDANLRTPRSFVPTTSTHACVEVRGHLISSMIMIL